MKREFKSRIVELLDDHRIMTIATNREDGWPPPDPAAVPTIRITPEIVSILDYSKGFGHTDLVRVTADDLAEFVESHRHHWAGRHVA
jgi:hypothetical protein